eukprot:c19318_g1_i1.p1 GENE.c19318_g1_i1~~c19318_g1_i1.p1  ORF type:complete len:328 (-),score=94.05 c19318_g1_i1:37-1020(-)
MNKSSINSSLKRIKLSVGFLSVFFLILVCMVSVQTYRNYQNNENTKYLCNFWSCKTSLHKKYGSWPNPRPELDKTQYKEWISIHRRQINSVKDILNDAIIFAGDDITEMWQRYPFGSEKSGTPISQNENIWKAHFHSNTISLNFGTGGDRVQDLAWRLENGVLEDPEFDPVAFSILIGAHDLQAGESPEVVVEEIRVLLEMILQKKPETAILLIGILPFGDNNLHSEELFQEKQIIGWSSETNSYYKSITFVNEKLLEMATQLGDLVSFVDCSSFFVEKQSNGEKILSNELMSDFFRLSPTGYSKLSSCIRYPLQMSYYTAVSVRFS